MTSEGRLTAGVRGHGRPITRPVGEVPQAVGHVDLDSDQGLGLGLGIRGRCSEPRGRGHEQDSDAGESSTRMEPGR